MLIYVIDTQTGGYF